MTSKSTARQALPPTHQANHAHAQQSVASSVAKPAVDPQATVQQSAASSVAKPAVDPQATVQQSAASSVAEPAVDPQATTQQSAASSVAEPAVGSRKKKGFKKSKTLSIPKGMERFMEHLQTPLQEIKQMMNADVAVEGDDEPPLQPFHRVGF